MPFSHSYQPGSCLQTSVVLATFRASTAAMAENGNTRRNADYHVIKVIYTSHHFLTNFFFHTFRLNLIKRTLLIYSQRRYNDHLILWIRKPFVLTSTKKYSILLHWLPKETRFGDWITCWWRFHYFFSLIIS